MSAQKSILFIINPKAGVDRVKAIQDAIDKHLDKTLFEVAYAYTEYPNHGIALARNAAAANTDIVVSVGGDGSLNDVVTGLQGTKTILGILPKGSGNGLARAAGIPLKLEKALQVINKMNVHALDLGVANGHYFISNAGVGFDAVITKAFTGNKTRGFKTYLKLIHQYIWRFKTREWLIEIDGQQIREQAFMITVANATQLGYNFFVAPEAKLNDGILDVVIIKEHPRILSGMIGLQAFMGALQQSRYVTQYSGKQIKLTNPGNRMMQVDGDALACEETIEINVLHKAINVLVP
ncbi:diacylglycerol kinase [Taibaiella sp. KBW10]|uniref:diacylglycerol/lipid kinase family protein n=1 Tax=Taibaiella sp. KBW10 TaxID=2153357 RepID=UPI000F5B6E9C|nr:YegS/Rv2252/BmrU family lipid kinase [Taibaiella sp. KBW10]RQO32163.1 diacylglycerol kinase [Taibaiella sp. KBW10]